jgi:SAM-dependent methyltransferase
MVRCLGVSGGGVEVIDKQILTPQLAGAVTRLESDLRLRARDFEEADQVVRSEWQRAHDAGRTAHDLATWQETLFTQVAVAWVLGTTFVRFCEDNGLIAEPVLAGPGERTRQAEDGQRGWYREHPAEGERGYVLHVFETAARLPGLEHVFESHNPVWLFGPSDDAVRGLLAYWREVDPETGVLLRDFTDPERSTRFLGDLYQELSESARKQYALLQTPEFVEEFILDRTLDPAIEEFGLEGFRMIDPACGSGHFLLGAFGRLFSRWRERAPQDGDLALAERALKSVYGIDLNPFAAAIARFRLLVAALDAAGVRTLAEAPRFTLNVAVGDSLLHGPAPGQQTITQIDATDPATRHLFATEDAATIGPFLSQRYHAVVANPPYITPKDPAANAAYRNRYTMCHRQYALTVPFMERLFDLAERSTSDRHGGFVGQITANSFMKREFGKPLIEQFLAKQVDLTHVIDTSGAYIPGHGTPTVILVGRNQRPVGETVRAVLGIRGEPSRPADPARGEVWASIVNLLDQPGSDNDYVSVVDLGRDRLATHPWSIQGGGADALKVQIESRATARLERRSLLIGYYGQTNADDAMLAPLRSFARRHVETDVVTLMAVGDLFRDWSFSVGDATVFPYCGGELVPIDSRHGAMRWLWPARTVLGERRTFAKTSYFEEGRPWWAWHQIALDRLRTPLSIAFAFVSTHNHFVLDRGGKVFKQSAPVIKLSVGATEDEHLALLGLLNSAVSCFWMKQMFHVKSLMSSGTGGVVDEAWEPFYEFDGTKLKQFPIPAGSTLEWAQKLDADAIELSANLPAAVAEREVPTRATLEAARATVEELRSEMVSTQEELDWRCLHLYGVTEEDLSLPPGDSPPIARAERAFEIVLARRMKAGDVQTTWFERHGSTPITELPTLWPAEYKQLVQRRIALIESDRFVGLVERPEYKRRWNWDRWEDLEREALRTWLLDRVEDARYWPDRTPRSAAELADVATRDADLMQVAQLYAGRIDVDLTEMVSTLVKDEAVPYLAAWRYTDSGLRKREAWERTWALQRREDAGEDVGTIAVPPKYGQPDFADKASWKLRGKLDVPKERFVAYPGLGRDTDPTPLVGWAGWDHLESAQALAAVYEQRRAVDGWTGDRLTPLLAGLAELVPWLKQWHNDVDPATGLRLGDFFADYVRSEAANHGLSAEDLAAWRPPKKTTGRKKKSPA